MCQKVRGERVYLALQDLWIKSNFWWSKYWIQIRARFLERKSREGRRKYEIRPQLAKCVGWFVVESSTPWSTASSSTPWSTASSSLPRQSHVRSTARDLDAMIHGVEPWYLDAMMHGVDPLGPKPRLSFPGVQKSIFSKKGQIVKNWETLSGCTSSCLYIG